MNPPSRDLVRPGAVVSIITTLILLASSVSAAAGSRHVPELSDPCPGDVTEIGFVDLPAWADVCAVWVETLPRPVRSAEEGETLQFTFEVAGVSGEPNNSYRSVRFSVDDCVQDWWVAHPIERPLGEKIGAFFDKCDNDERDEGILDASAVEVLGNVVRVRLTSPVFQAGRTVSIIQAASGIMFWSETTGFHSGISGDLPAGTRTYEIEDGARLAATNSDPVVSLSVTDHDKSGRVDVTAQAEDDDGSADLANVSLRILDSRGHLMHSWSLEDFGALDQWTLTLDREDVKLMGRAPWTVELQGSDKAGSTAFERLVVAR